MAHELGHVWIYTHHPFLQTEELANEIAMRVVSRELLESLYQKVWERTGTKGKLTYLPGSRTRDDRQHRPRRRHAQANQSPVFAYGVGTRPIGTCAVIVPSLFAK